MHTYARGDCADSGKYAIVLWFGGYKKMDKNFSQLQYEISRTSCELTNTLNLLIRKVADAYELIENLGSTADGLSCEESIYKEALKNMGCNYEGNTEREIYNTIYLAAMNYIEMKRKKELLITSKGKDKPYDIRSIFNLDNERPVIIAGPCAVEKPEYIESAASLLSRFGISFLRGGAYKPRTSPYDFQGLGEKGLRILNETGKKYNLLTVSEVVDTRHVEMMAKYVDMLQIGARNMHNYELLKEVGSSGHPVLLKRGMNATVQEFMLAAEYIALYGNRKIVLCERGIRTFETNTRNTLDISSIPIIKKETDLSIIVDVSHSLGRKDIVAAIAKAVLVSGADGLMMEVHPFPELALSDCNQQLNLDEAAELFTALGIQEKREG